jgi:hypothetical protein
MILWVIFCFTFGERLISVNLSFYFIQWTTFQLINAPIDELRDIIIFRQVWNFALHQLFNTPVQSDWNGFDSIVSEVDQFGFWVIIQQNTSPHSGQFYLKHGNFIFCSAAYLLVFKLSYLGQID